MRIKLPALASHLKNSLAPLYHLFGAEILLLEEALEQIRQQAREQGFTERLRYTLEPGFDWQQILIASQSKSLFSTRKIIELRMPSGKPGEAGGSVLTRYVDCMEGTDTILLLISGAIDKRAQSSKWFKKVEAAGLVVECPAILAKQLPEWIMRRMRAKQLQFEPAAAERLSHFVEGNLLAAAQEINLLALLSPNQTITAKTVENTIADHARFTVYALADACLAGATHRCARILQSLRHNQTEPILVLWALTREIRMLCQLANGLAKRQSANELFAQHRVWSSRKSLVNAALKRLTLRQWESLLRQLAKADLMLKGQSKMQRQNIWEEIEIITLRMCGLRIC